MVILQAAFGLAILAVCAFAPGFYFVRRLRWSGVEKLCGSVALSLILLWLASWGVYVSGLSWLAAWAITGGCILMGAAARSDAAALFRGVRVRRTAAGFAFVVVWMLLVLAAIRNYSGAGWRGDWLEHFQRSLFFLDRFPVNIEIFGNYQLPARPPAMNVLGAFVMAQAGDHFEVFQAVFAFLNLLMFLPCAMALPMLARPRRPGVLPLAAVFAASPVIMQNATYTWTKSLTAFFVILAILLYLKGWRRGDSTRIVAAFLSLTMGMLAHYSAGPYIGFLALHYLVFVFPKRRQRLRELAMIGGLSGALLATWFAWSMATYGVHTTFASNTSITTSQRYEGHNLEKIASNVVSSTVPPLLRDPAIKGAFQQPNHWGYIRDHVFIMYQCNLILCMGSLGGLAVVWLLWTTLRHRVGRASERAFWIALIVWSVVVGIAVVGEGDPLGVAHLTLVPMAVLGMTLLASRFAAQRALAWMIIVGCVIDFGLGVYLHARMEHAENTAERPVFLGLVFGQGRFRTGLVTEDSLSPMAWDNWMHKHQVRLAEEWGRSVEAFHPGDPAYEKARIEARGGLERMKQDDEKLWQGWFRRHDGETAFLGDQFGNSDAPLWLLVLVFAGLMWKMAQIAMGRRTIVVAKAPVKQPQHAKRKR